MRRTFAPLAVALVILLATTPILAETGGLRYSISVSKFENRADWSGQWSLGDAWGSVMTDLLQQSGKFIVLGEADMRGAGLDEQDFAASGRAAQGRKAPVTGQMTPAQLFVKGAITHVQGGTEGGGGGIRIKGFRVGGKKKASEVNATIYIVDSTTGQVVASKSVVGKSTSRGGRFSYSGANLGTDAAAFKSDNVGKAIEAAVGEAVEWMISQLPNIAWTGSVVLVKSGKIYINRGTREGVQTGQEFLVGEAEVIRDPDTGEVLDESINEVARVRADSVKEKLSICSVISGNSGAVRKGMAVHVP